MTKIDVLRQLTTTNITTPTCSRKSYSIRFCPYSYNLAYHNKIDNVNNRNRTAEEYIPICCILIVIALRFITRFIEENNCSIKIKE